MGGEVDENVVVLKRAVGRQPDGIDNVNQLANLYA
jgi:hypothetical protein